MNKACALPPAGFAPGRHRIALPFFGHFHTYIQRLHPANLTLFKSDVIIHYLATRIKFAPLNYQKHMNFIVSSVSLLRHLQQIHGVINSNTVLPILEDFLFILEQNKLTLVATDLETVMKVSLTVESKDSGRVCIPARILIDSLKNIPEQPLRFSIDKNFAIEITSDNGKYKIMGENPDNFPKEPAADDASEFTMPSAVLLTAINKTIVSVSNDDLRPAMTGVFLNSILKASALYLPMHTAS